MFHTHFGPDVGLGASYVQSLTDFLGCGGVEAVLLSVL